MRNIVIACRLTACNVFLWFDVIIMVTFKTKISFYNILTSVTYYCCNRGTVVDDKSNFPVKKNNIKIKVVRQVYIEQRSRCKQFFMLEIVTLVFINSVTMGTNVKSSFDLLFVSFH